MTCPECENAAQRLWHGFQAGCQGCAARAAARSPAYHHARTSGTQDADYRQMLARLGLTHEQVKEAARMDDRS